tara:strand:- start:3609 stop:4415 length:807 start_codon:yes stop_codon:yes gene_type:complete
MGLSLQDTSSYSSDLTVSSSEAFAKYGLLIVEYLRLAATSKHKGSGEQYAFVLARGVRTLTHVFRMLLLYTRNLDLTWHHCQKAAYYYIEFMGQIGGDAHGFLQLNARDASLFVYRKTIFEVNDQYRREFGSVVGQDDRWDNIDILTGVYGRAAEELIEGSGADSTETAGEAVVARMLPLSRGLLNLALVGTEGGYLERLKLVRWIDQATIDWGSARLPLLECFARKLRTHKCALRELVSRFSALEAPAGKAPAKLVSWLIGRRAHVP